MKKLLAAVTVAAVSNFAVAVTLPGETDMTPKARQCAQRADQVQTWAGMLMLDATVEQAMAMADSSSTKVTQADRERAKFYVSRAALYANAYKDMPLGREGEKTARELAERGIYIASREAVLCMNEK
jgi:hypothetical protein